MFSSSDNSIKCYQFILHCPCGAGPVWMEPNITDIIAQAKHYSVEVFDSLPLNITDEILNYFIINIDLPHFLIKHIVIITGQIHKNHLPVIIPLLSSTVKCRIQYYNNLPINTLIQCLRQRLFRVNLH